MGSRASRAPVRWRTGRSRAQRARWACRSACALLALACVASPPAPQLPPPVPAVSAPSQTPRPEEARVALVGAGHDLDPAAPKQPLMFGALTRRAPMQSAHGPPGRPAGGPPEPEELAREAQRGDLLEEQIQAEIRRQEELLQEIEAAEATPQPVPSPGDASLSARADPRAAPVRPMERELPRAIFDEERVTVPAGTWDNRRALELDKLVLDADRDGLPEQVRYVEPDSGELVHLELDRDFDGSPDAWSQYERGALTHRTLDTDGDGAPDTWERYRGDVMSEREIDRDGDGVRDAFYRYELGSLVEERHDPDNDGRVNVEVRYEDRRGIESREDRDGDGRFDTWTLWRVVDGEELVARIERDTRGDGRRDVFETFSARGGRALIEKREEDRNGDGSIDVVSIYENGKLVRREINDPSMVPL